MRSAQGMTLLEVLIATTILASLTAIVSTLWAQTKQWTDETATHDSALRLQRTLNLLDRQWESRLLDAKLTDGDTSAVRVDEDRLEFVTTESVLFSDWPLVKAVYIATRSVEIDPEADLLADQDTDADAPWRLVYEETKLGLASSDAAFSADAVNLKRSALVELTERPRWSVALSQKQITEWESTNGPAPIGDDGDTGGESRWIDLTDSADRRWVGLDEATNPEAVRLDGATAEGGFQWALVGRPLR